MAQQKYVYYIIIIVVKTRLFLSVLLKPAVGTTSNVTEGKELLRSISRALVSSVIRQLVNIRWSRDAWILPTHNKHLKCSPDSPDDLSMESLRPSPLKNLCNDYSIVTDNDSLHFIYYRFQIALQWSRSIIVFLGLTYIYYSHALW